MPSSNTLPVLSLTDDLIEAVNDLGRLLLRAPTGSGKSTCVPQMLLDGGVEGLIVVVQPRRIAARMLSRHVASLRKVRHGDEVGHVVRFENCMNDKTRIVYVTDGVLQRWIQDDPKLSKVGAVVFDEFHERRIASDVALARCLEMQESSRADLKLVVMSATLEVSGLKEYLEPCSILEADGRAYPVEISYRGDGQHMSANSRQRIGVWDRVAEAAREASSRDDVGHILIFLPGVHEIRRSIEIIERSNWSSGWDVCPLYSGLSPQLQEKAVAPLKAGGRPRIIVSTNVAETSLTIDGVRTVIDAGLARVSRYDTVRGLDTLMIEKISRASADQRAGRAGRTAEGRCVRLWSEADHGRREAFDLPEIHRVDLAEVILSLKASGVNEINDFRWLDAPEKHGLEVAEKLLYQLNATDDFGAITEIGFEMAKFALHPRYSRLLIAGQEFGCVAEVGFIAAAVQSEGVFVKGRGSKGSNANGRQEFTEPSDKLDFIAEWRAFQVASDMGYDPRRCGDSGILARGARELEKSLQQLKRVATRMGLDWREVDFENRQDAVNLAMLSAFSDRLAVRLGEATLATRVVGGRRGQLDSDSAVKDAQVFIATEMTEVEGKDVVVYLNRCAAVDLEHLRKCYPDEFIEIDGASYDVASRRVVNKRELRFRDLILESKEGGEPPAHEAARLLAERIGAGELKLNSWDQGVDRWIARLVNLSEWMPEMELPGFSEDDRLMVLEEVCQGSKSYKDIKNKEVMPVLNKWLSQSQMAVLNAYAPLEVTLSNGKKAKVKYSRDGDPYIAMKMQFLYDVVELPEIAQGRAKLLVHILAPNQRAWQVTGDLAGFWERGYPQMKKDLAGRYPRQDWR
ncbi:ATP-dependent helicase HrpB [Akkermansiaceae bacterium]|nr:ATP-dependent helicase HrpB [Akkermansiaceae bacterium]